MTAVRYTSSGTALEAVRQEWVSVMAFDPGTTTGWAWLCFDEVVRKAVGTKGIFKAATSIYRCGQIEVGGSPAEETVGAQLMVRYVLLSAGRSAERRSGANPLRTVVVCEGFTLRQRTMDSSLLSPVRLQAKLEMGLADKGVEHEWFEQSPSDKSVITDERLKAQGLWTPGQGHANDAMRHLVLWLRRQGRK